MRGCCSCSCCPLKPRYKELVDNIFPSNPEEGLRKANMDKLTFYAVSSPEKLDRIGEYIAQRVNRDILSKRKQGFVLIAMEAMDQLLLTCCHSKTLNIFVQSFLKTVQKLLECTEPQLQILASQSFIKFANIQEETPTYHLRFDFFVSKFCSMCHDGSTSLETRAGLRRAGLNGIHGVVRKTVSEELVESIWEPAHMDKIIPSLLFNMFDGVEDFDDLHRNEDDSPAALAETTLRELVGRAPYGKLETVMKACLHHLDSHHLWWPNNAFAVHVFRVILFAIQARYSQVVMQLLMRHLEAVDGAVGGKKRSSGVRMGIADVIRRTITIAASETVGLSPLEIINSLLNHLRRSVERKGELEKGRTEEALEEEDYQGTLINAMGEYTTHLPDYQKIEILKFVMGKVPLGPVGNGDTPDRRRSSSGIAAEVKPNVHLQKILLRSMLKVAGKYQTRQFANTFQSNLLEPLVSMSLVSNPKVRVVVQHIFHSLIDRHGNLEKLLRPTVSPRELELETEKCSSNDLQFFKRRGPDLLAALYAGATLENNTEENLSAIVVSVCLLCLEINSADTMVEVIRLCLNLQELALRTTESISVSHRFCLHAAIAAVMAMVGYLCHNHSAPLRHHIEETISLRVEHCPHLLPPLRASYPVSHPVTGPDLPLFKKDVITEALQDAGLDPRPLEAPISSRSNLLLQPPGGKPRSGSSDLQVDCESGGSSSPGRRRSGAFAGDSSSTDNEDGDGGSQKEGEQVTLESLRKVLQEPLSKQKEALAEKARQVAQLYQSASFTELLARKSSSDNLHAKLEEIFANEPLSGIGGVPEDGSGDSLSTPGDRNSVGVNIPDLYVIC